MQTLCFFKKIIFDKKHTVKFEFHAEEALYWACTNQNTVHVQFLVCC
jgi:hypothetical protein